MLDAGVDAIIMIDMTTSGVRFFKTYDVVRTAREVVAAHNKVHDTNIGLYWVNDPNDLMRDSYPDKPAGWTRSLGVPEHDPSVPLANHPNPVSSDPRLAAFHVEGIEHQFRAGLPLAKTGVLLVNHATRALNHLFDPKVDDTLVLNRNIKRLLLAHNPQIDPDNIVGGWMGIKEHNPAIRPGPPQFSQLERTRRMRGENLGYAYLYESDEQLPGGEWRYRYWDALDRLRQRGVEHIVVAFPQIMVDSGSTFRLTPSSATRSRITGAIGSIHGAATRTSRISSRIVVSRWAAAPTAECIHRHGKRPKIWPWMILNHPLPGTFRPSVIQATIRVKVHRVMKSRCSSSTAAPGRSGSHRTVIPRSRYFLPTT
jgi:hypothetical protein